MRAAADEVVESIRVLEKVGLNLVGEVLRGQGRFYELEHYPPEDVFDRDSQAQYYYHAHRGPAGEHGHFHTFLRAPGMPQGVKPIPHCGRPSWPSGRQALSHLVAISMDRGGRPIGLFAVNRWISAMMRLFRPEIEALLRHRDAVVQHWPAQRPGPEVFEDRRLEVTGYLPIDLDRQLSAIDAALRCCARR